MTSPASGRWYFGWNIVAASSVLTLLTVGLRMGIGPFFLPIAEDLGFSRSLLSTIIAVGMLFYGIGMPFVGQMVNKWGTRTVLFLGIALIMFSIIWTTYATGPISFLLSFGILLSLGLSFISPVAFTPLIARWFTRQRGAALFFLSTGSMAGIALATPALGMAIPLWGWRATMIGYGLLTAIVTVPLAIWIMRENAPEGTDSLPGTTRAPTSVEGNAAQRGDVRPAAARAEAPKATPAAGTVPPSDYRAMDAIRTRPFWQVVLGLFACGYSMNLLGSHGVPMLVDHGYDSLTAAVGIGLIGFAAIFSTIVLGRLSDRLPRRNLLAAIYLIRGLGFIGLLVVGSHTELFTVALIGGIVWAGSIALSSAILADIYGVRLVGVLYGWTYLGHQVGGMISSWLGGWAYEQFGTHWVAFGSTAALLFVAALVSLRLPLPGQYFLKARAAA